MDKTSSKTFILFIGRCQCLTFWGKWSWPQRINSTVRQLGFSFSENSDEEKSSRFFLMLFY